MFQNSLKQGNAGLGKAIAYFTINGYGVCIPLTDSEDWDLIVSKNNILSTRGFLPSLDSVFEDFMLLKKSPKCL